jgi:2'-5' RNA ligase
MPRLFVAIEPSIEVADRLEAEIARLARLGADVKWASRSHLHVTLRFLGEVADDLVPKLRGVVLEAAGATRALALAARGSGTFPPGGRPRVVWAGVSGRSDAAKDGLVRLRRTVHDGASALGCEGDRDDFHPHVTLGRVRSGRRATGLVEAIRQARDTAFGAFEAREVVLFESRLSPSGSAYTALLRAPLG